MQALTPAPRKLTDADLWTRDLYAPVAREEHDEFYGTAPAARSSKDRERLAHLVIELAGWVISALVAVVVYQTGVGELALAVFPLGGELASILGKAFISL
jgi:hypothetical protein